MISKDKVIRKELETKLLKLRPELLWSYKMDDLDTLPDHLIISKFLVHGNVEDWNNLREAFSRSEIKKVWEEDFLLGGFQINRQKELVAFFFGSKNPSRYISDNKRRKLQRSLARSF